MKDERNLHFVFLIFLAVVSLVVGLFVFISIWIHHRDNPNLLRFGIVTLFSGIGFSIFVVGCAIWERFYKKPHEPFHDELPNYLGALNAPIVDCDGVGACIIPEIVKGICYFNFFVQNRFEKECDLSITVDGPLGIPVRFNVEGGSVGVYRKPVGIPGRFQGKVKKFSVRGKARYKNGRGRILLWRKGASAGPLNLGSAVVFIAASLLGFIFIQIPFLPELSITLPEGVAVKMDVSITGSFQLLEEYNPEEKVS